jgi:hypothetical protein
VLFIAAGDYDEGGADNLQVNKGLTLKGVHRDSTRILCNISDQAINERRPVVLEDLYCQGFLCGRPTATAQPTGSHAVRRCYVDGRVRMAHGGGFSLTVDSTTVAEDIEFGHGQSGTWVTRDAVRWCVVGEGVGMSNLSAEAAGRFVQVVHDCQVFSGVRYTSGDGAIDTIRNNVIETGGLDYRSGESDAYLAYNHILNGNIVDASGSGRQLIVYNQVNHDGTDEDLDLVVLKESGVSATIKHNTFIGGPDVTGIRLYSGDTTICDSNYVRTSGDSYCIITRAGYGQIIGNTLVGARIGVFDKSRIAEIAHNTIDSCGYGVFAAGDAWYHHNTIANCVYDGLTIDTAVGRFDHNTITDNGGTAIRITYPGIDLGGGAHDCLGGNVIERNLDWNLVNETSDTIWAKFNFWDHTDSASIDGLDIYDDDENGSYGPVIFTPIGDR